MRIKTKVAGVKATNDDGRRRQEIIRQKCRAGMALLAVPEPDNANDANAIAVLAGRDKIGYLKPEIAEELRERIDQGDAIAIRILEVTGGTAEKPSLGLAIEITVQEMGLDNDDAAIRLRVKDQPRQERPRPTARAVQTVEATSKKWKGLQAIGCLGSIAGLVICSIAVSDARATHGPGPVAVIAGVLFTLGLPVYVIGRIGAWWENG